MSAVRSGAAQYKRWHSSIIKAYVETLGVQIACYTQHICNFLASSMYPSDAVLFHVDLKTRVSKYHDTSSLFTGQSAVKTRRGRVSLSSCDLTSQIPFDVCDAH